MTPPEEHLDLDTAAALDEGLEVDDAVRAHAASCPECARRLGQVRATRALLSALPDEAMPPAVAERVRAALPAEPVVSTIIPGGPRARRLSSPTLAGLLAAAAAIALVAAISIGALRSSNKDNAGGSAAGGAGVATAPRLGSTNFRILATGEHYTDANSQSLVGALDRLARTPVTTGSGGTALSSPQKDAVAAGTRAAVPAALQALFGDRQQLLTCARLLAGGPVTPLAIDFARFTGGLRHVHDAPAMIVLLPGGGGLGDSAFIVGPRCTTDPSQDLYKFQAAPHP
ncbi:MAG TPA: hypothetical protein VFH66_06905 [Mycobacteriales bacterium]|nr:hypothetical protein [Mycobacteriales bacterium]